ncbi:hypothetical protein KL86DES1_20135 [uncultured Desulfovibrio sp.]|uniref:Uncharacterized protein n=1 Tax=uncultured Desulfovibrio sp. TaxID=167968 RepID=A0A212L2A8_9BACT|nr:hypothetical protein KL86DES1_20135 [uncultured Desulfovibrio sp.]VZH33034.1 conserved protein of unknown function [Desulfovibrio sp. 86]
MEPFDTKALPPQSSSKSTNIKGSTDYRAFWKRAVISFGKARSFFEAGVDFSVLDCFKKSEARRQTE